MSTVHVMPVGDLIEHDSDGGDCPCGPRTEPVPRDDGSFGWLIVHHSLDGREKHGEEPIGALKRALAALHRHVSRRAKDDRC